MAGIRAEFVGQDKLARTCATSAVPKPTKKRTNAASKKPRNTRKAERFAIAAELGPWKRIKIRSPLEETWQNAEIDALIKLANAGAAPISNTASKCDTRSFSAREPHNRLFTTGDIDICAPFGGY